VRRALPAAALAAAFLAGALLAPAGCGLEHFVILSSPLGNNLPGTSTFQFQATSDNSEIEFRGFELYYKIFATSATPVNYYNTFDDLVAAGYRRVYDPKYAPGSVSFRKPLIAPDIADYGTSYTVTVDFNIPANLDLYPQIVSTGAVVPIPTISAARRAIIDTGLNQYKLFRWGVTAGGFASTDADITPDLYTAISGGQAVRVVMFVLSYGIDTSTNLEVYSLPVWLGTQDIAFP
jgi:hypothetical protein